MFLTSPPGGSDVPRVCDPLTYSKTSQLYHALILCILLIFTTFINIRRKAKQNKTTKQIWCFIH